MIINSLFNIVVAVAERGSPVTRARSPKKSPGRTSPRMSSLPSGLVRRMATEPERTT